MTPQQANFVQRCESAANELALAFAGEPTDRVAASLNGLREALTAKLSFGDTNNATLADLFVKAVMARKAEIELGASMDCSRN